jgi:hypothetical protein
MLTLVTCVARKLQKNDGCTAISDHDVTCDAVSWFKILEGGRRTVRYVLYELCKATLTFSALLLFTINASSTADVSPFLEAHSS